MRKCRLTPNSDVVDYLEAKTWGARDMLTKAELAEEEANATWVSNQKQLLFNFGIDTTEQQR